MYFVVKFLFVAAPRHSSSELDSALGLIATLLLAFKMLTHFRLYIYNPPKSSFEKEDFKVDAKETAVFGASQA